MKRECSIMKSKGRENAQAQASAQKPGTPKKNLFCSLQSRSDQEISQDVVNGILKLFFFDLYALLDQEATLSVVTLLYP